MAIKNLTKGSKYSFEVYTNKFGSTVVYIKKGRKKVWLFNIDDGVLGFDIGHNKQKLEVVGLRTEEDIFGQTIPQTTGIDLNFKELRDSLARIEDRLERTL